MKKKEKLSAEEEKSCSDSLEKLMSCWQKFRQEMDVYRANVTNAKTFHTFSDDVRGENDYLNASI